MYGAIGFGMSDVSGIIRKPRPAAIINACFIRVIYAAASGLFSMIFHISSSVNRSALKEDMISGIGSSARRFG
jgi:hypothetical protein